MDLPSHERANKARKDSVPHKTKESHQKVSIPSRPRYILRFVIVGDLLDDWAAFGGISSQLSHLSIVLHLATVGNATLAIIYDSELRAHIQRLARLRGEGADSARLLTEENTEIKQRLKRDCGKNKAKKAADKSSMCGKNGEKGGKKGSEGEMSGCSEWPPKGGGKQ